ncbi:phosphotransferase family protein [Streptomyces acidiscabies]|uniref:Phosphotransferase n=1 Tax=Streptomyces acidiscabies TaxID=42234 RepID=A0AAP6B841_9ACTN|nr:phosphotransferase [Streptomyces acidiscabies]MBP5940695.1 phosphotransferase [Streptomyces sp. LBUM 1476]MBZ3911963.1 phosphotransferase [Streptomyces acidiscabies]MDX2959770.1 phosphotransferase [Streptomyces acidiscabies]MDX3022282.1 phosphotransferase [Streptomyces acidiscabies]MDX3792552.1 phosphotransferase [Streptomyces acidiscabies]
MNSAPPATGVRLDWEALPASVRDAVAGILGAPVVRAVTQRGGFSPGVAARVVTRHGKRGFVKAVSGDVNSFSPVLHRREARNAAALPREVPAPKLLGVHDDGNWVALVFEDVDGRQPHMPWRAGELQVVLDAVGELGRVLTPAPFDAPPAEEDLADAFGGWPELVEQGLPVLQRADGWEEAVRGDTLAHGDLRADNVLLAGDTDRVWFVDWPHVTRAAPWFDLLLLLPSVRAQGGPDPETVFTEHPLGRRADQDAVTVALAALAGYFLGHAGRPAPPGLPTLRPFQQAQGDAALDWLRTRVR